MKKKITAIIIFIAIMLSISGCGTSNEKLREVEAALEGTWRYTVYVEEVPIHMIFEFSDGEFISDVRIFSVVQDSASGTYRIDQENITLEFDDTGENYADMYFNYTFDNGELSLASEGMTFVKIG